MNVSSGASWSTTTGMRQWEIGLNDNDGEALFKNWNELGWNEKMKLLQKRADILVIKYMLEQNAITEEFAQQRIKEILS